MHFLKRISSRLGGSIQWKLGVFVAVVVTVSTVVLSVMIDWVTRDILRAPIHDRLSVVASDRQRLLLGDIQQQQERVGLVASRTRLRQLVGQHVAQQMPMLVVDDNFTNRRVLSEMPQHWHMQPVLADSAAARQALQTAEESQRPIRLILLDHHTPGD